MAKRIRPAKHYQRKDNAARALMLTHRKIVAKDLRDALRHLPKLIDVKKMTDLLERRQYHRLGEAVNFHHYNQILKVPFARIADAYEAGAKLGVRKINAAFSQAGARVRYRKSGFDLGSYYAHFAKASGDRFNFDMFNSDTQATLRDAQDELIQQLESDARDTIEQVVMNGALAGLSPADLVDDIRSVIGLTDTQGQAVLNYQMMLENLDPTALARQLRNKTMDETVQDAIDSGEFLSGDVIDQMVQDYADNYLDYRASTIAQTESVRAINQGLHDSYSQAIETGALPEDAVTREWELGDSPCPICESIPDNNPDGVGVNDQFDSDDGPVDDPPVHPNCMCSVNYITDISQIPTDEPANATGDEDQFVGPAP